MTEGLSFKSIETAPLDKAEVADDVLDLEVQTLLLEKLKERFEANMPRHEGVLWADVQRSLEVDPSSLWKLQQMENAGHKPDIYKEDDKAYHFGTCSAENPESARNLVYDAGAQAYFAKHFPEILCNGNVVDIAAAMGVKVMSGGGYLHLQTLGKFDVRTWSLLKTPDEVIERLSVLGGNNSHEPRYIDQQPCYGFRASIEVSKA